jgi:hypothetical protein
MARWGKARSLQKRADAGDDYAAQKLAELMAKRKESGLQLDDNVIFIPGGSAFEDREFRSAFNESETIPDNHYLPADDLGSLLGGTRLRDPFAEQDD